MPTTHGVSPGPVDVVALAQIRDRRRECRRRRDPAPCRRSRRRSSGSARPAAPGTPSRRSSR
ncbi:MAG: hypothetical protein MZV63_06125 [Marinilabiliales bacterium]|nr:hypothetical protein [Marinilabiliales bacterium]